MADEIQNAEAGAVASSTPTGDIPGPTQAAARFDRVDWFGFFATTLIAMAGYLFTLAPNVTLEFSGITSAGAYYAGVPHPPGYPVWTLYSWLFTKLLPFSNIAWRIAVGSAVASAVACGLVALMISRSGMILFRDTCLFGNLNPCELAWLRLVCGAVAGLVLAFSGTVWEYALLAETRAMSLLLFTGVLCLLLRWMIAPDRRRFLVAGFFLFGMLLTNNQDLLVALPGLVVAIILLDPKLGRDVALLVVPLAGTATAWNHTPLWIRYFERPNPPLLTAMMIAFAIGAVLVATTRRAGTEWKAALGCGLAFLLGLAFYFYVPVASMSTPPVNWGYPRTVEGFVHVISRGQYERLWPTDDLGRFVEQTWSLTKMIGRQFGWLYLVLALVPLGFIGRVTPNGRRWLAALAVIWITVTFLMLAELNPPPDRQAWEMMAQYFAASHAILAVWLGLGLMIIGAKIAHANPAKLEASPVHEVAPDHKRHHFKRRDNTKPMTPAAITSEISTARRTGSGTGSRTKQRTPPIRMAAGTIKTMGFMR